MSHPPSNRPPGRAYGPDHDPDGKVLFDPAAYSPYEAPRTRGRRGWRRALVALIGLSLLGALGYGAYATKDQWLIADELDPLPPPPLGGDSVTAVSEPRLEALSQSEVRGQVQSTVALAVRAMGPTGPMVDSSVLFEISEGGDAELTPEAAVTDARGVARAELTLPSQTGQFSVTARLAQSDLQASFSVRVLPGPPALVPAVQGEGQRGEVGELLEQLGVFVTDASGNPVPGVDVRFSTSGGIVGPTRTRTDSTGLATTRWRLGSQAGPQRAQARVEALDTTITFVATATARPVEDTRPQPLETRPVTVIPREFVIGTSHVCSLSGGAVSCRGATVRGQGAAEASGFIALASGASHVCGLDASGTASCWGANNGGQLGDGTLTDRSAPVAVRTDHLRFSMLTAGVTHTCGLAGGGVPVCWGQNLNGQVGDGSKVDRRTPVTVGGGMQFRSLVAGWNHTCGLSDNGNAFCWGLNNEGQLGDGTGIDRSIPEVVRAPINASLTAGSAHTCGISGSQVLCWGDNAFGQLGDGSTEDRPLPDAVLGLPGPARQLAAGAVHTCALMSDGSVYCWGQNLHGQLGNGTNDNALQATRVAGDVRFSSIHAGGALTCGWSLDGSQYCWGLNQYGQLGDGTRQSRSSPTPVG